MKFLIASFLFIGTALADSGSINWSNQKDNTGAVLTREQKFIDVYNSNGSTLNAGEFVILDLTDDDGMSVTETTTAGQRPHCMITAECGDTLLCKKCQVKGFTDIALFDSTRAAATAGEAAYLSESFAGYAAAIIGTGGGANLDDEDVPLGIFYDNQASSATVQLYLDM